jgi:hypothetical protein
MGRDPYQHRVPRAYHPALHRPVREVGIHSQRQAAFHPHGKKGKEMIER